MKIFACKECGYEVRRPSPPLKCEACGEGRIGLFREIGNAKSAPPPPPKPAAPERAKSQAVEPHQVVVAKSQAAESPPLSDSKPTPAPAGPKVGGILWEFPVHIPGQLHSHLPLRNCPAIDAEGRIFAAIGKELIALDPAGSEPDVLWRYETGGHIPGSPVLGGDGRIRVHSGDGRLYCVNTAGGEQFSPVDVGEPFGWASPIVDGDGNTWICAYSGGLLKVDPGGSRRNTPHFRSRQKFDSTGLIYEGVFYVGAEDGFIYAIELNGVKGANRWDHLAGRGKTDWFINASLAKTPDKKLIVAGRDEYLYCFDLDGTQRWKLHIRGQMLASPVVDAEGRIYVGVSLIKRGEPGHGRIICVDGQSHRIVWEYDAAAAVESTPLVADDGAIYFGDNSGVVYAVASDGRLQWSTDVGSPVRSAAALAGPHRLVFGLDKGSIAALHCESESFAAGGWPKYMGAGNLRE